MRITLRRNTTTITGVIAGAVMRIRVVSELAPDMRLASSREASIRPKAGFAESVFPSLQPIGRRLRDGRDVEAVEENQCERIENVKAHGTDQHGHQERPPIQGR